MEDIVDTAQNAGNFSTLVKAAKAAGLVDTLKGEGPLTVFAPTDAAFNKIPREQLDSLLNDRERLSAVLKNHVVPGRLKAQDVAQKGDLQTAGGPEIHFDASTGRIEGAEITQSDIEASNGVVHAIDSVLMPR